MDILKDSTNVALRNIDYYQVWGPVYEGFRIILNSRGLPFTPQYISGISGEAFSFYCTNFDNEHRDSAEELMEFMHKIGFDGKRLLPENNQESIDEAIDTIIDEIDNGRALILWNAFTVCEWDVICGYNKKTREFLGRGSMVGKSDYATENWNRAFLETDTCKVKGAILLQQSRFGFDIKEMEINALKNAIAHARNTDGLPDHIYGHSAYKSWADEFGKENRLPSKTDQYHMAVYASLHSTAYMFLKEIMGKYPKAADILKHAAFLFREEASYLQQVFKLVFNNWQLPKKINPETNEAASELLHDAASRYKEAIDELEKALEIMAG